MKISKSAIFMIISSFVVIIITAMNEINNSTFYYLAGVFFICFGIIIQVKESKKNEE